MSVDPLAAGFDADRLGDLVAALQRRVDARRLPGAVIHIERRGHVAAHACVGQRDPQAREAMTDDAIFRIFSMTKPIVSVAAMRLFEQGLLRLDDPVSRFLPEFAGAQRLVEHEGEKPRFVPARAMTVQDLLRHTAGLTYEFLAPSAVRQRYIEAKVYARQRSAAEQIATLAGLPLQHEPGSVWEYSRATDVLGRLVEVVAGRSLGEHLQQSLFAPLGMVDTGFRVASDQHHRLADGFVNDPDSGAASTLYDTRADVRFESGGGGLLSTTADYARFVRMLLAGGTLDGSKILGPKTVEFMTADHLGSIPVGDRDLLPHGYGFGLGFAVRLQTGVSIVPGSAGAYGWGGLAGTLFFVDPEESMFAILMIQAPQQREEFQQLFRNMVYAAIER